VRLLLYLDARQRQETLPSDSRWRRFADSRVSFVRERPLLGVRDADRKRICGSVAEKRRPGWQFGRWALDGAEAGQVGIALMPQSRSASGRRISGCPCKAARDSAERELRPVR
jgi:hypothetical protein